jgi:hypothetical protein
MEVDLDQFRRERIRPLHADEFERMQAAHMFDRCSSR